VRDSAVDERRLDKRLVALNVDDDAAVEAFGYFGDPVSPSGVVGAGHHGAASESENRSEYALVVRGHHDGFEKFGR
jgi:hypothetical protein